MIQTEETVDRAGCWVYCIWCMSCPIDTTTCPNCGTGLHLCVALKGREWRL